MVCTCNYYVMAWKHSPHYWPFARGIYREFPSQRTNNGTVSTNHACTISGPRHKIENPIGLHPWNGSRESFQKIIYIIYKTWRDGLYIVIRCDLHCFTTHSMKKFGLWNSLVSERILQKNATCLTPDPTSIAIPAYIKLRRSLIIIMGILTLGKTLFILKGIRARLFHNPWRVAICDVTHWETWSNFAVNYTCLTQEALNELVSNLEAAFNQGIVLHDNETYSHNWDIGHAISFCITLVTTIGKADIYRFILPSLPLLLRQAPYRIVLPPSILYTLVLHYPRCITQVTTIGNADVSFRPTLVSAVGKAHISFCNTLVITTGNYTACRFVLTSPPLYIKQISCFVIVASLITIGMAEFISSTICKVGV